MLYYNSSELNFSTPNEFLKFSFKFSFKKIYEKAIRMNKCSIKVVERAGTSIKRKLQKLYPFGEEGNSEECVSMFNRGKRELLVS